VPSSSEDFSMIIILHENGTKSIEKSTVLSIFLARMASVASQLLLCLICVLSLGYLFIYLFICGTGA
jgi:hypothetical protein